MKLIQTSELVCNLRRVSDSFVKTDYDYSISFLDYTQYITENKYKH